MLRAEVKKGGGGSSSSIRGNNRAGKKVTWLDPEASILGQEKGLLDVNIVDATQTLL